MNKNLKIYETNNLYPNLLGKPVYFYTTQNITKNIYIPNNLFYFNYKEYKNMNEININNTVFITNKVLNNYSLESLLNLKLKYINDNSILTIKNNLDYYKYKNRIKKIIIKKHLLNGIFIENSCEIDYDVLIKKNSVINNNTIIKGKSYIGFNSIIGPNSFIINSKIGNNNIIKSSYISDSIIFDYNTIGPFSNLRDNNIIGSNNRIGNFIEIKNSVIKDDNKIAHHAYIGDSNIGNNNNFGCGSITVNFDGLKKHKTIIEDNIFIGSNSILIAPIHIESNSFIAAGSTINKDVPSNSLAIARARQTNKLNYIKKNV